MAFPETFINELIERNDISDVVSSYVALTNKGSNQFGLCPFHNEKTPSFSVSPSKQIYHCFGCSKGGGVINFIMEIENLSYPDAVHFLAKRAGITVPEDDEKLPKKRARLLALNREAARYFNAMLRENAGAAALEYTRKRQISPKTVTRFGLGAAPDGWDSLISAMAQKGYDKTELLEADLAARSANGKVYDKFRNRLMFPVIDLRGEVVGFGGRVLEDGEPKYLNSKETITFSKRRVLYGMNLAKNTKRENIILCEGNVDVISLHQAGFDNAAASMGTALTAEQIRMIARYKKELIICYDNDEAGKKAAMRAIELVRDSELKVRVLRLPDRLVNGERIKTDADDYIKRYGGEAFERLLSGSGNHIEYLLEDLISAHDLSDDASRVEYLKKAVETVARLPSPVEREIYGGRAAEAAGVSADAFRLEAERVRKRSSTKKKREEERAERPQALLRPVSKRIKYANIRSAAAEEGIIRLILHDQELISACDLKSDEFSEPFLGKLYKVIKTRFENKQSLAIPAFSSDLDNDEMSQLVRITQKPESAALSDSTMNDYITVIRTERLKSGGVENLKDLLAMAEKMREKKGYGG